MTGTILMILIAKCGKCGREHEFPRGTNWIPAEFKLKGELGWTKTGDYGFICDQCNRNESERISSETKEGYGDSCSEKCQSSGIIDWLN